jgi:hypothetical protein
MAYVSELSPMHLMLRAALFVLGLNVVLCIKIFILIKKASELAGRAAFKTHAWNSVASKTGWRKIKLIRDWMQH